VRADVEGSFRNALRLVPGLHEAVESGRRDHRFAGTADLPNLYRESAGPGWALAGDAGHHKDPCSGMGMSDAFLAADLLAGAIHDGLTGRQPMDAALARYQTERDQLTANGFELTLATARLAALPARHQALYQAAAEQPDLASQVFGVIGGSIPVADVYSDTHIQAVLTQR
jgi:flavin-dependent dehydrogenase